MIIPFVKHGLKVKFYPVYLQDGGLVMDIPETRRDELLLVMDYFGYKSKYVAEGQEGVVIRDLTHTVISNDRTDADFYFGSLRKWCGFRTGGFALGVDCGNMPEPSEYISLRREAMEAKEKYILGNSESKDFLKTFAKAEQYLENSCVAGADPDEIELADKIDVEFIKLKRRENAALLMEAFPEHLIFGELGDKDCPLFVPVALDARVRDELRRYLISKEIYLPIHWPVSSYHELDERTRDIYDCELSLVCDQRYGQEDMYRMINAINDFFKR
jgi:hypothetical protein